MINFSKFWYLVLFFITFNQAFSKDCAECLVPELNTQSNLEKMNITIETILNFEITPTNANEFFSKASLFLNQIKDTKDFNESTAEAFVKQLKEIVKKSKLSNHDRARAQLLCSGIVGRLADKKQSAGLGKESFEMVKASMEIDPSYKDAKSSFVTAVTHLSQKNFVIRKIIESSLNIQLSNEVSHSIKIIENENWQNEPKIKQMYEKLKAF